MRRHLGFLAGAWLASASAAALPTAQGIDEAGPFPVGWREVTFSHSLAESSTVTARIFYPALTAGSGAAADPSEGPYPAVAFIHGAGNVPTDYDLLCNHVASWGFVVASVGTPGGFATTIPADTRAMLHWVLEQGDEPTSFIFEMPAPPPWGAVGHSTAGSSLFALAQLESQVATLVAMEPGWDATAAVDEFSGDLMIVAGSHDPVTPPAQHAELYMAAADGARRRFLAEIQGGGHEGPLDVQTGPPAPLEHEEEQRMHRRYVTGFLRAEVSGDESLYFDLLGGPVASQPVTVQSQGTVPVQWIGLFGEPALPLVWGLARKPGDFGIWLAAPQPGTFTTPFGTLGLEITALILAGNAVLAPDGTLELALPVGPSASGVDFHFQGLTVGVGEGGFTEAATVSFP